MRQTPPSHWWKSNRVSSKIRRLVCLLLSLSSFSFRFNFSALLSALSRRLWFISLVTRNSAAELFSHLFSISFSFSFYNCSLPPFIPLWGIPWLLLKEDKLMCYCMDVLSKLLPTLASVYVPPALDSPLSPSSSSTGERPGKLQGTEGGYFES